MKMLIALSSLLLGFMNRRSNGGVRAIAAEVFDEVSEKSHKVVTLTMASVAAIIFLCGGVFISILNSTGQYDVNGFVTLTATLGAGLALMLVAAITLAYVFLRAWPGAIKRKKVQKEIPPHKASTLEQALSVLVMDFVKERELRRQQSAPSSAYTSRPQPEKPEATTSGPMH